MFISERLRAAVFYTGGQARVGEFEACVCVCMCVCDEVVWMEAQRQPSSGLLTKLIWWAIFDKKDLTEVVLLRCQALLVELELP